MTVYEIRNISVYNIFVEISDFDFINGLHSVPSTLFIKNNETNDKALSII